MWYLYLKKIQKKGQNKPLIFIEPQGRKTNFAFCLCLHEGFEYSQQKYVDLVKKALLRDDKFNILQATFQQNIVCLTNTFFWNILCIEIVSKRCQEEIQSNKVE